MTDISRLPPLDLPAPEGAWPRILVTGASGFVGAAVVQALHQAGAEPLRAGVARWPSRAQLPVQAIPCDLLQPETLDAALDGVEVVIHCARIADDAKFIAGTRSLLQRARAAGVRKVVHLSSVAVYGDAKGRVGEESLPGDHVTAYGRGKLASEEDCRAAASAQMSVNVIRPALIYGPRSELWTTPYLKRLPSGRWPYLGAMGEGRANLIHVGDLVRFIAFLAARDVGVYAVFNANGPDIPNWNDYLDQFADTLGAARPDRAHTVSRAGAAWRRPIRVALRKAAARNGALARVLEPIRARLDLYPTVQELDVFALDVIYAGDKAKRAGFVPVISLEQGLADCVAWARTHGLA
jgi:UDP-glucose 4-epimerase